MKTTISGKSFVLLLLFATIAIALNFNVATANFMQSLPEIVIKSDGSIAPETEFITRSGRVYSLAADLQQKYAIRIQCSSIVFDGEGHFINGSVSYAGYINAGLALDNVSDVTIKNVTVIGFGGTDVNFMECAQCSFLEANTDFLFVEGGADNEIADNTIGELYLGATRNNTITRNNITDMLFVENSNDNFVTRNSIHRIFFRDNNDGNSFFMNNFWCGKDDERAKNFFEFVGTNFWDNGSVGNYRFDYRGRDGNYDGIGDAPYLVKTNVYDELIDKVVDKTIAQDNFPLIAPYDIKHDTVILSLVEPVAAVFTAVFVSVGLLVYLKKSRRPPDSRALES